MYRLIPDAPTVEQVAALPDEALLSYAEVRRQDELRVLVPESCRDRHHASPASRSTEA